MLRFRSLGSGSAGNALLVEASAGAMPDDHAASAPDPNAAPVTRVLIDCGLGQRQLVARLAGIGLTPRELHAIFITHEHSDHVGCAPQLAQKFGIPIWMSHGTWSAIGQPDLQGWLRLAADGRPIALSAQCELHPFTVPHDAREPLQLVVQSGGRRMGICTDLGHPSAHVVERLQGCHALLLESNHDPDLLAASRYPVFLKRRVAGALGHLSNAAAADLLARIAHPELQLVVAAHLSEQNNRPELALSHLQAALDAAQLNTALLAATAAQGCDWQCV
jgi:phosphoribosyl 1,2-cyclic phosphodiesterase